jgi:glucose-1-phosphate thymidylyltransferase
MTEYKGIILAGGSGTRLYPATSTVSKQLLSIYDKPMIYYPLSTLMLAGIRDILIISSPEEASRFHQLFYDGTQWGLNIEYEVQDKPDGIASAFKIGANFLGESPVSLILGDNIFYGQGLTSFLSNIQSINTGATIIGYQVNDPSRYGVVELDKDNKPISLIEKPSQPKSNLAITGLYFYDNQVKDVVQHIEPSARGELEITDVNNWYLNNAVLHCEILTRGYAWLDTGTHDSLLDASSFIATLQKRQGLMISCPEEIAFLKGWIDFEQVLRLTDSMPNTLYKNHLLNLKP